MQDWRAVHRLPVQLAQRAQRRPGESQPRRGVPLRVRRALIDGRSQRVGDGEEVHLPRVAGRRLPGIEHARRPGVQLQPVQRLELPFRSGLGIRLVARREVVEMKDHLVVPGGVNPLVHAVEPFRRGGAALQVDVAGEPPQGTVDGNGTLWLQESAEPRDLLRAQCRRRVEIDGLAPLLQRAEPHPPDDPAGQFPYPRRLSRQQDHAVYAPDVRHGLAASGPDLPGLVRDPVRLLFHQVRVLVDPSPRPVLDLDDPHTRRTDGDHVDLVRLELVRDRPGQVGQQHPPVVAGPQRRLDAASEMFERRALALVGERPAREMNDLHRAVFVTERRRILSASHRHGSVRSRTAHPAIVAHGLRASQAGASPR